MHLDVALLLFGEEKKRSERNERIYNEGAAVRSQCVLSVTSDQDKFCLDCFDQVVMFCLQMSKFEIQFVKKILTLSEALPRGITIEPGLYT